MHLHLIAVSATRPASGRTSVALGLLLVAVALFAGYLCTLAHYSFEPAWVSGLIVLYMSMGLALVLLRERLPDETAVGQEAAAG